MTEQFRNKDKAWSARFSEPVTELVKRYTASVGFDQRLAMVDIRGSLAHAEMLADLVARQARGWPTAETAAAGESEESRRRALRQGAAR